MPTYEYKCEECGINFERFQHFADDPIKVCPECGGAVRRVIQPVGIIFKGSGFYVTDNKSNTSSLMPKSDKGEDSKPSSKADSDTKAEAKPAATATSKNDSE